MSCKSVGVQASVPLIDEEVQKGTRFVGAITKKCRPVGSIHGPDEIFKLVTGGRIYRQGSCGRVWTIVMLQGDCHTGAASAHHASPALKSLLGPDCVVVVGLYVRRIVK